MYTAAQFSKFCPNFFEAFDDLAQSKCEVQHA
jgi:hypothetical protein